jgi:hypothetical protein
VGGKEIITIITVNLEEFNLVIVLLVLKLKDFIMVISFDFDFKEAFNFIIFIIKFIVINLN